MNSNAKIPERKSDCKQGGTTNLQCKIDSEQIDRAIYDSVWPRRGKGVFSVAEIKELLGVHERTVYSRLEGQTSWTKEEALTLILASVVKGGSPLLDLVTPDGSQIVVSQGDLNGQIVDEVSEEVECLGAMAKAYNAGDYDEAERQLDAAQTVAARAKREIKLAKSKRK